MRLLGLDLGATHIKSALVEEGRVVATASVPTRSEDGGPPAVLERLVELGRKAGRAGAVGLLVPGLRRRARARGGGTVMCVVCGTGIGGGLVLDGRLHLGPKKRAGEFGHHTVVEDGPPCGCGTAAV